MWTHCTGERGCGGLYQTDYCNQCQTDEWTPEQLEEFRWSPYWIEHEANAQRASERGRFSGGPVNVDCDCGRPTRPQGSSHPELLAQG